MSRDVEDRRLVEQALAEDASLTTWRAVSLRLRPAVRAQTDREVRRRMGPCATEADHAEGFDIVWRALIEPPSPALQQWPRAESLDDWLEAWAGDAARARLRILDRRLAQRWRAGDARAGNRLYERLRAVVYARVTRVLRPRGWPVEAMDDAAQEAWIRLSDAIDSWRPGGGSSLENWTGLAAERSARSLARDRRRLKRGRDAAPVALDDAPAPVDGALTPEESARIVSAVTAIESAARAQMSPQALGVALALLQGRSVAEVADAFALNANQIYKATAALKKLAVQVMTAP